MGVGGRGLSVFKPDDNHQNEGALRQRRWEPKRFSATQKIKPTTGGRNSSLVVFELAVHSVAGSILFWRNFPVEGIFPLELTWVQTPFPPKLFRMRV